MDDIKVYTQEIIDDIAFPAEEQSIGTTTQDTSGGVYGAKETKDIQFPQKRIAVEVLSTALNTKSRKIIKEFQFTPSGAIQIGDYKDGTSGDIRISPDGIVARNKAGDTTFTLDGNTGDAVFAGQLQAGTVITDQVVVGNNNVIIDGLNRQIIVNDGTHDRVLIGFQEGGF